MQAEWKIKGIFKADAQKVADEIGESKVTPQEVLEKAKDENSELHKCFEWNDTVAAEKYRLGSTSVIASVNVFSGWECEITVSCADIVFPAETIVSIINTAGKYIGIGTQRANGFGRYHVADVKAV